MNGLFDSFSRSAHRFVSNRFGSAASAQGPEYIALPNLGAPSSSASTRSRKPETLAERVKYRYRQSPSATLFLALLALVALVLPFITFSSVDYRSQGFGADDEPLSTGSMGLCPPWRRLSSIRAPIKSELVQRRAVAPRGLISDFFTCVTYTSAAVMSTSRLADWLKSQRESFLYDVRHNKAAGWVIAVGNEAGDLDSLASSISYAALSSFLDAQKTIPLILTPANMLRLRPENRLALSRSLVPFEDPNIVASDLTRNVLLHAEQLPVPTEYLAGMGARFALVDHNSLLSRFVFSGPGPDVQDPVVAIIDHHQDDGRHLTANPRIIQVPTGSCASLVAQHFEQKWKAAGQAGLPSLELSTLLVSAQLIDTGGLKAGAKAKTTEADRKAFEFMLPMSELASSTPSLVGSVTLASLEAGEIPDAVQAWADQLDKVKNDVSTLSGADLLRRDYKEFDMPTSRTGETFRVGMSTVPLGVKDWLGKVDGWKSFMEDIQGFMMERELDVCSVLTTYRSEKKGKHKRELLVVYQGKHKADIANFRALQKGLLSVGAELELEPWNKGGDDIMRSIGFLHHGNAHRWGWIWDQKNAGATRKQVQPIMVSKDTAGARLQTKAGGLAEIGRGIDWR